MNNGTNRNGKSAESLAVLDPDSDAAIDNIAASGVTKRRGSRTTIVPTAPAAPEQSVTLNARQAEKLWDIVVGGKLTLRQDEDGRIVATVSLGSFAQALPILLDRL